MHEYSSRTTPPNFCAGLTQIPPDLLEVKDLYWNINIGTKKSKGFIQSSTSAIWPFRKFALKVIEKRNQMFFSR
jgi:type III secretory pathway component EscR